MDAEKIKIKLNNEDGCCFAGQPLKGEVTIILLKKTKIKGIKFRISGKGKCSWFDFLRRESQQIVQNNVSPKQTNTSISYSGKQIYLCEELYIYGGPNRSIELDVGEHKYDLNYTLNINLPSSVTGQYGSIKYKCKIIIEKSWNFDEKFPFPITITKYSTIPRNLNLIPQPVCKQITHCVGVITGSPITLSAQIPSSYILRNEKIQLLVTVDNKSSTTIEKLKFSMKQLLTFYSQQPTLAKRTQIVKLFKKETGEVLKKTMREFHYELDIPPCQPTENNRQIIIHIDYEIQVELILPAFYKNILLTLPVTIYSCDIRRQNLSVEENNISVFSPNNSIRSFQSPNRSSSDTCSINSESTVTNNSLASFTEMNSSGSYTTNLPPGDNRINNEFGTLTRRSMLNFNAANHLSMSSNSRIRNEQNISLELPPSYHELFYQSSAPAYSDLSK